MTSIADVRGQFPTVLAHIGGSWFCTDGYVGDKLSAFQLKVSRPPFDPRMVMSGTKAIHKFRVTAYAPRAESIESEKALDALCELSGSGSMKEAVETSSYWGSVSIDYAQVVNVGETAVVQFGLDAAEYLAVPFDIEVVW